MIRHSALAVLLASAVPFASAQEQDKPWGQADEIWGEAEMAEAR